MIKWSPTDDPSYDACGRTKGGCWCDVVHNYKNKWSAYVGGKFLGEYDTKELGMKACEDYIQQTR